ncbi:MAG: MYG1 family protein [Clostridia bacterium]|nr:MYG1 family protein [Clostridia bacterium]
MNATAITHAGPFHGDDIFCMVFLEKLHGDVVVFRDKTTSFDKNRFNPNSIIFDIGYEEFDHHQKDGNGYHSSNNPGRKPVPYASFGLLWARFGLDYCKSLVNNDVKKAVNIWNYIEKKFVIGIDAVDNAIFPTLTQKYDLYSFVLIPSFISMLTPLEADNESMETALENAVCFARVIFDIIVKLALNRVEDKESKINYKTHKKIDAIKIFTTSFARYLFPEKQSSISQLLEGKHLDYHTLMPTSSITKIPVPTSTIGKLWHFYGKQHFSSLFKEEKNIEYCWEFIKSSLVLGLDAIANGIVPMSNFQYDFYNPLSIVAFINSFNLLIDSRESYRYYKDFAYSIANTIVERTFKKIIDRVKYRPYIEEKINKAHTDNSHVLVLEKHIHWQDWVARSEEAKDIWFVVTPSNREGYSIYPVPYKRNENGYRKGFPKAWHGLNEDELRKKVNIPSANFVHPLGFIAGTKDLDSALELAEKSSYHNECKRKEIFISQ